ncbi:DUF4397 domain-containing protein [uncultured Jatrophihabitans sp.]|uniref:DUF4397 domain-containing protein n=1 Tax=uncultured Jatrophihabitans sp. TaxID=1610747 RepID=UPI0035CBD969
MPNRLAIRRTPLHGAAALAGVAVAAAALAVAAPAAASTHKQAAQSAYVRVAHLSPDTGGVDVYLTAFTGGKQTLWVSGVGYGDFSGYRRVPSGTYAVSMRPHDAPASTQPALSWTLRLGSGQAYTAAAIGMHATLHGVILGDSTATPKADTGLVRIIQASNRAGSVDVTAGATEVASDTPFGSTTPYRDVAAGQTTVVARSATQSGVRAQTSLRVGSRTISTVVVLDKKGGGVTLRTLTDAAGAATAPSGAVDAGGGGTAGTVINAGGASWHDWLPIGLGAALVLAAGAGLWRRAASRRS